jgi:polyphenol oxidase
MAETSRIVPDPEAGSPGPRVVAEEPGPGPVPHLHNPGWRDAFPWLVHGITHREYDLRLSSDGLDPDCRRRWEELGRSRGMGGVTFARQVHGSRVRIHGSEVRGVTLAPDCDGHATGDPGILLAVTVADCVPVFLAAPEGRAVALLHAGWRGVAAGIVEEGVGTLTRDFGAAPGDLHAWLGPAISGDEYEVGPEVHEGLGLPVPGGPTHLDLREVVARRLRGAGLGPDAIGVSKICTRRDPRFYSHRGGDEGRQAAFIGIRAS